MEFTIGEKVFVDLAPEYDYKGFDMKDVFVVVDREIIEEGEHYYTVSGKDGELYETYSSSLSKIKERF